LRAFRASEGVTSRVGDMASDGSFAVNYTGTGFAPWFGF
jgi:hypothetical protein